MKINEETRRYIIDGLIVTKYHFGKNGRAVDFAKRTFQNFKDKNNIERFFDTFHDWNIGRVFYDEFRLLVVDDDTFTKFCEEYLNPIYDRTERVENEDYEWITIDHTKQCEKVISDGLNKAGYELIFNLNESGIRVPGIICKASGTKEPIKNIIFAADKVKPDIVVDDVMSGDIRILNESDALVYSEGITSEGITWKTLMDWYKKFVPIYTEDALIRRLENSLDPGVESIFFKGYISYLKKHSLSIPALLPQVYLYYDPKTELERGKKVFEHQRMDFMIIISPTQRVVIELDGVQHYGSKGCKTNTGYQLYCADKDKYADMMEAHRDMVLKGYDVYRFGGKELWVREGASDESVINKVEFFFERLFAKYCID